MTWFRLYYHDHVSQEDWMMHNGSVSLQFYVEYTYTNSPFFQEQLVCGTRYQTSVSQRTTTLICLRIDATPTFVLDEVIFDVIGVSLKSEHLTPPIVLFLKKYVLSYSSVIQIIYV